MPASRDEWWPILGSALAEGISEDDIVWWCANGPGFKESDARATICSLARRPQKGGGSLFALAREAGWREDQPRQAHHKTLKQPQPKAPLPLDVEELWGRFEPPSASNPYIAAKNGLPDGLRQVPADHGLKVAGVSVAGWLALPARSHDGTLRTIQFIPPPGVGKKLNLPGAPFGDGFFLVGDVSQSSLVFIVEGVGQAWACWRATGQACAVTFGAGRTDVVANAIHKTHPLHRIVLVPDRGKEHQAAAIATKLNGGWVELPQDKPANYDANDFAAEYGSDDLAALLEAPRVYPATTPAPLWQAPDPIGGDEWRTARAAPDCVVQDYLFADVGVLIAPGGTGKTTLMLVEAIHIVLGLEMYGLKVHKPGAIMILTAEGSREMLVARLREIAGEMGLSEAEKQRVRERVRISDLGGTGFRLTEVDHDVVVPTERVDALIEGCRTFSPVLIVIDPAVSFGVGESRVNDSEQGLIEAARKLRRALNCCVRYIHHSGKANAREKSLDQYSGRGGSAFADGARMVTVLQSMSPPEWRDATGTDLNPGEQGLVLARPKLSYAPPAGAIYLRRHGYRFERVEPAKDNAGSILEAKAIKILDILFAEIARGHHHSRNTLESIETGLSRADLRKAVNWLQVTGRVEERSRKSAGRGGASKYLHPYASPATGGEATPQIDDCLATEKDGFGSPPPIGETMAANQNSPPCFPSSYGSPNSHGEATASLAKQPEEPASPAPSWTGSNGWGVL